MRIGCGRWDWAALYGVWEYGMCWYGYEHWHEHERAYFRIALWLNVMQRGRVK